MDGVTPHRMLISKFLDGTEISAGIFIVDFPSRLFCIFCDHIAYKHIIPTPQPVCTDLSVDLGSGI